VGAFLFFALPVRSEAPIEVFEPKEYLARYTDDPFAEKIINCESNWKPAVYGDGGNAYGRPQFWEETFYRMQRMSGDNPMYQWGDERAELRIFAWAIENNFGYEWTCYHKVHAQELQKSTQNDYMH